MTNKLTLKELTINFSVLISSEKAISNISYETALEMARVFGNSLIITGYLDEYTLEERFAFIDDCYDSVKKIFNIGK